MATIPVIINNECFVNSSDDDEDEEESDDEDNTPDDQHNTEECIEDLSWFHVDMSRNTAESLLLSSGLEGNYLLRSSGSMPGNYSVSVRCLNSVKHFSLEYDPYTKSYIFGLGQFNTLKELLEHFDCQPVIGSDLGSTITLKYPYPKDIEEHISYEEISRHADGRNVASSDTQSIPDWHIASKEGYLVKRGAIHKNWKKRWFILQKNCLSYFKRKDSRNPIRTINLRDATRVCEDFTTDTSKNNCFRLCLPYRIFYFYASSHVEAGQWMKLLQWKIDYYRSQKESKPQDETESIFIPFPPLKH